MVNSSNKNKNKVNKIYYLLYKFKIILNLYYFILKLQVQHVINFKTFVQTVIT